MRTVKISELKAKLCAHIEFVKHGEEVLILDRQTPVARLVSAGDYEAFGDRERRLIAKGILTPPKEARTVGAEWLAPTASKLISRDVMDQVWRGEREGR